MSRTRRDFLADTLRGSALLSLSATVPDFLRRAAAADAGSASGSNKVLVVVQLSGGNDGLNTVVPYLDDRYYRARPSIAVDPKKVHKLTDDLALNPVMGGMGKLFQEKALTVIEGVGYENPNRSHFVSMDIWHSAKIDKPDKSSGWLGRALENTKGGDVGKVRALAITGKELPLALVASGIEVPTVEDLKDFQLRVEGGSTADQARRRALLRELAEGTRPVDDSPLAFVSGTLSSTYASAEALSQVAAGKDRVKYPGGSLARKLQQIAQVIAAGFGTRIYYCTLGGFDTHARQVPLHTQLLTQLSDSLKAFWDDIKALNRDKDVMVLAFSEFGRRVEQNASHGTDHGTAAPVFVVGGGKAAGLIGSTPNLGDLRDDGDLKHRFDFRQVYATVLDKWLGIDSAGVLGARFEPLPFA